MFVLFNTETEEYEEFTRKELFEMMSRDRSNEWSEYDENSTIKEVVEGINHFCEPYKVKE